MRVLKGFVLAWNMLTIIPLFKIHDFFKGINGYAVMFYPLVGFILGMILVGVFLLLEPYLPKTHLLMLLFALWVLLTGALHLDGLSDTIDALFVSKERRLEVLKDPHVGAMGMTFTGIFLLLKASAVVHLESVLLLPLVLMFSRLTVVIAIYFFEYIRKEGMSSLAKQEFTWVHLLGAVALTFALGFFLNGVVALCMLGISIVWLALIRIYAKKLFGGFSGDIYGFTIETTELVLLHVLLFNCAI